MVFSDRNRASQLSSRVQIVAHARSKVFLFKKKHQISTTGMYERKLNLLRRRERSISKTATRRRATRIPDRRRAMISETGPSKGTLAAKTKIRGNENAQFEYSSAVRGSSCKLVCVFVS